MRSVSGRSSTTDRSMNAFAAQLTIQTMITTPMYVQKPCTEKSGTIQAVSAIIPMLISR